MTRYLSAIGIAVWLCVASLSPPMARADEKRERHLKVDKDDDGYELKETETRHGNGHGKNVHVKEHVKRNDKGDEVREREEHVEHDDD